jgi:hypothetical protein
MTSARIGKRPGERNAAYLLSPALPPARKREQVNRLRAFPQGLGDIPQMRGASRGETAVTVLNGSGIFIALGYCASFWLG